MGRRTHEPAVDAVMWRDGGRWIGRLTPDGPSHSGASRAACLAQLRKEAGTATLTVEVVPELVGVAEAAGILGWDKRRIFTYISRGSFPEPVAMLASGRVWRRVDIEAYAAGRRTPRPRRTRRGGAAPRTRGGPSSAVGSEAGG